MKKIVLAASLAVAGADLAVSSQGTAAVPQVVDEYYPPEEAAESKAVVWPRVVRLEGGAAVLQEGKEPPRSVRAGQSYGAWEVVAILPEPDSLAVLERSFDRWGLLVYVGPKGPAATLRKAVGRLERLPPPGKPLPAEYFDRLLSAQEDVLGLQVVEGKQEPSYERIAGLLPPLDAYTFLGTITSRRKPIVLPDGRIAWAHLARQKEFEGILFDPWTSAKTGEASAAAALPGKRGLVGGYLPVIDFAFFDPSRRSGWEEIAFAVGAEEPELRVRLRTSDGKRSYWQGTPPQPVADASAFYRDLLTVHRDWEKFFAKGMRLEVPEPRVRDSARAAIMRALISYVGLHPKYGNGGYWAKKDETFPPTTLLFNTTLLDWGFAEEARERLSYYISRFVKDDGTFDYYGPAVSEYGQMLTLAARLVRLTGDGGWLRTHLPRLERIGNRLLAERAQSRARFSPGSPTYGLLFGAAEADTAKDQAFYFSGDVWCWRGLAELGQVVRAEGQRSANGVQQELGQRWLAEAASYREDILKALGRSRRADTKPPFIPPIAGMERIFARMTEDTLASYTNYRYWLEMLSPGLLPAEMRDEIIVYRTTHGGELAGTTRFRGHMDDWPYAHYAWALLEADRVEHYLLGFYGHLALHQTPGTFNSYEQVAIRGTATRNYVADYCVPVQLVTPQLLRWMLVSEAWDGQDLWLARAAPRRWYAQGFAAGDVPTRWGPVSLRVAATKEGVRAEVEALASHPNLTVHVRLRAPNSEAFRRVKVEGAAKWRWEPEREVLHLSGDWKRASIVASR